MYTLKNYELRVARNLITKTCVSFKTTEQKVVLTSQKCGPYKTTKLKVDLTTQTGGPYKTNICGT